jgi:hypothetical protein
MRAAGKPSGNFTKPWETEEFMMSSGDDQQFDLLREVRVESVAGVDDTHMYPSSSAGFRLPM